MDIMQRMIELMQETAIRDINRFLVVRMRITRDIRMLNTRPLEAFVKKLMRRNNQLHLS
jgi:hypothetical protein